MTSHTPTPRSTDPEDISKRNFIKGLCASFLGLISLMLTWPLISFLIPEIEKAGEKFIKVPNFSAIPTGVPSRMTFEDVSEDAFIRRNMVYDIWVIKNSATEAIVYSPVCPHLSCRFNLDGDKFVCPCHGSIFNVAGKVLGGPSPRPLDTLPHKIEGGELYVNWKLYKAGIHEKVEA